MNYKAGDDVICIDAKSAGYGIKTGAVYRVASIDRACCSIFVRIVGCQYPKLGVCPDCGQLVEHKIGHYAWRFIKLDGLTEHETTKEEITA